MYLSNILVNMPDYKFNIHSIRKHLTIIINVATVERKMHHMEVHL